MASRMLKKDGALWVPWRYGGNESVEAVGRSALVAGVHKPGPGNTGPYTVTNWVDVFPSAGSNEITVSTTVPQYGKRYWGCVKTINGARFNECWFVGPDPLSYSAQKGAVQNFGTNPGKFEIHDSIIDAMPWVTIQGRAALNPYGVGFHGANVKIYRTEITNVHDGFDLVGPNGNTPGTELAQFSLIQQCWIHKGKYTNDVRTVNDGQIHCDGVQSAYGRNWHIIGNTIGGTRVAIGYNTWPGWAPSNGPGYNAGDDWAYAAVMLTQETPPSPDSILFNVLVDKNWLGGGTATVNIPTERGNDGSGITITNNRFMRRGADWGRTLAANAPDWIPYQRNTGAGSYVTQNNNWLGTWSGNVYEDTGLPVPTP